MRLSRLKLGVAVGVHVTLHLVIAPLLPLEGFCLLTVGVVAIEALVADLSGEAVMWLVEWTKAHNIAHRLWRWVCSKVSKK